MMAIMDQNIGDALVYIADKLGVSLSEIVKVYANMQLIFGVLMIVESLTFVIGVLLLYRWVRNKLNSGEDVGDIIIKVIIIGVVVCLLPVLIDTIASGILRGLYPDYYAIETLIHQISD